MIILTKISVAPFALIFALNFNIILQRFVDLDKFFDRYTVENLRDGEQFDFIIVGAGSSGSTLANRLSEKYRVLLLEAGGVPNPIVSMPMVSHFLNNREGIDWRFRTVPQKHAAFALNDNVGFWGAGKGLGGSSVINGAIYLRGNIQGFDTLADETGDPIWKLENIVRYYKNVEDYNGYFKEEGARTHGKDGEIGIEGPHTVPFIDNLLRAGQELGYKVRDPNGDGPLTEGFAPMDSYQKHGRKQDAYTSFLRPIISRSNLVIRKFSFVRYLLLNGTTAYGVEYERYDSILRAVATKEVILCAGALQTPKLLMLSGIGPKNHLKELGIPLRVDLPVGKILEDKYGALVGPFVVDRGNSFVESRDLTLSGFIRWLLLGTGSYATGRTEASYQIISDYAKSEGRLKVPDIHVYVTAVSPGIIGRMAAKSTTNLNEEFVRYISTIDGQDTFFQMVAISKPFGRGSFKLADRHPHSYPIIDPKYLVDERDVRTLVEGIKFSVKLVEATSAFREINAKLVDTPFPSCQQYPFKSDSYFECFGRHVTVSAYKFSATAPIGDQSDPNSVVDSRFRVLGTKGLRVVDGSVLRVSTVAVNDITCRVLGILAADMIKWEWSN